MPLLLINFHGGTIYFYFIILFIYLINLIPFNTSKIITNKKSIKYLFIPFIIGIPLIFINPFFVDGLLYALKTLGNNFINLNIAEFQPLNIKSYMGEYFYLILLVMSVVLLHIKSKIRLDSLLLFIGTSFMTLLANRYFALFVLCSIPCLSYMEELIIILGEVY